MTQGEDSRNVTLRARLWIALAVLGLVLPLTFGLSVTRGLSHDEHQHVAAGALLAREGLLPFRDYPYFHTPYLPFVYAGIFNLTDHLMLGARLFSFVCSALTAILIFLAAFRALKNRALGLRFAVSFIALFLFLANPLFTHTVGHAWNQEPSVLCLVGCFLLFVEAWDSRRRNLLLALSGICLGLAVGLRITLAPTVLPFALAVLFVPPRLAIRERIQPLIWFGGGLTVAMLPLILLFAISPEQTLFGTIGFAKENIEYRESRGGARTMTIPKKLRYFAKDILRSNWAVVTVFLAATISWFRAGKPGCRREVLLGLFLIPFLCIGTFAPSPSYSQYYYPLTPFALLIAVYAAAARSAEWLRKAAYFSGLVAATSAAIAHRPYHDLPEIVEPRKWVPFRMAEVSEQIRREVPRGDVLTLGPIFPLEADLNIYPAFATGPFAWRVSPFVDESERERLKMVSAKELDALLAKDAPEAILVRLDKRWEDPLIAYARKRNYHRVRLVNEADLWIAPTSDEPASTR